MGVLNLFKRKKTSNKELLILYGTKSGNSKLIAQRAEKYITKNGISTVCKNLSKFAPEQLQHFNKLLVIISTHGEGDPPPSAEKFFKQCNAEDMIPLKHLSYSICALGDSSYKDFCWAGKELDQRFTKLGAQSFYKRVDCDTNFSEDAVGWIKASAAHLIGSKESKNISDNDDEILAKQLVYTSLISKRKLLTGDDCQSPTYHISLDISNLNLGYNIGDNIELIPENPKDLLNALSQKLKLDEPSKLQDKEITRISFSMLKRYAHLVKSEKLDELINSKNELDNYLAKANFLDLLSDYPTDVDAESLLKILTPLKGRKYSIASSQKKDANQLDLCIKTIRYQYNNSTHEGAASVYANETLTLNSTLHFKHHKQFEFKLPADTNAPIIMIGVSTGIAPFRAMLQEMEINHSKPNTWLIWGNRNANTDYLYQDELLEFRNNGTLNKLDTAFSRDGETKTHVQDIIESEANTFIEWLNKGAHIYICGSIKMGKSVKAILHKITKNNNQSLQQLITDGRLHEDVY